MTDLFALFVGAGTAISLLLIAIIVNRKGAVSQWLETRNAFHQGLGDCVVIYANGSISNEVVELAGDLLPRHAAHSDWEALHTALKGIIPDFPRTPPNETLRLSMASMPGLVMELSRCNSCVCMSLMTSGLEQKFRLLNILQLASNAHQRQVVHRSPIATWTSDSSGNVTWFNAAYAKLAIAADSDTGSRPLFPINHTSEQVTVTSRTGVDWTNGSKSWFEVVSLRTDTGWLNFAINIDTLVDAEMAQRNFVQTLTKTFAHLPIGLAVFNKDQQLVLFNPALVDLTDLPVDYLSCRPDLFGFFDQMRDNHMMPEPKNYDTWRSTLSDVISAARDGRYRETWNLPNGLIYRVTGRPHPDGAIAFLIEDISSEISLTRKFRAELDLKQSVLNCVDDALVVFSQFGQIILYNQAYCEMWGAEPQLGNRDETVANAVSLWSSRCNASPIWSDLRDFVTMLDDRAPWDAQINLQDGRALNCTVEPVFGGNTVVRFSTPSNIPAAYDQAV